MSEKPGSRIEEARSRAATAKRRIAGVATAAFVVALGLAYASHPGDSSSSTSVSAGNDDALFASDDDLDFGYGSIAPSGDSAPQVRSGAS